MSAKIMIVGEAPSRSSDPKRPFDGYSGKKLAEYAGLSGYEELSHAFLLRNLMQRWPGVGFAGEKGSRFPMARAKRAAKRFKFDGCGTALLAGKRVAAAFGMVHLEYFAWKLLPIGQLRDIQVFADRARGTMKLRDLVWCAVIPHPSGCNAVFNYQHNREEMSRFMRKLLEDGDACRRGVAACAS